MERERGQCSWFDAAEEATFLPAHTRRHLAVAFFELCTNGDLLLLGRALFLVLGWILLGLVVRKTTGPAHSNDDDDDKHHERKDRATTKETAVSMSQLALSSLVEMQVQRLRQDRCRQASYSMAGGLTCQNATLLH